jgi:hypothetical protein
VLADLREARAGGSFTRGSGFAPSTLGRLELFAERYLPVRDELAWRAARGEVLSDAERALLHAFDQVLDELDGKPEPLPAEIRTLVDDVLRRH